MADEIRASSSDVLVEIVPCDLGRATGVATLCAAAKRRDVTLAVLNAGYLGPARATCYSPPTAYLLPLALNAYVLPPTTHYLPPTTYHLHLLLTRCSTPASVSREYYASSLRRAQTQAPDLTPRPSRPCSILLHPTPLDPTLPCRTLPCRTLPCCTLPCRTLPGTVLPQARIDALLALNVCATTALLRHFGAAMSASDHGERVAMTTPCTQAATLRASQAATLRAQAATLCAPRLRNPYSLHLATH